MAFLDNTFAVLMLSNFVLAFIILPWCLSKRFYVVAATSIMGVAALQAKALSHEYTTAYSLSCVIIMITICLAASVHLHKR